MNSIGQTRTRVSMARVPPWRRWVRGRESVPPISFNKSTSLDHVAGREPQLLLKTNAMRPALLLEQLPNPTNPGPTGIAREDAGSVMAIVDIVCESVPALRKFLLPTSPFAKAASVRLDSICESIMSSLPSLTPSDKVKVVCAFGQLREYSVVNRVPDRYNNRPLSYGNQHFYSTLVSSIDWTNLFSSELSRVRTLAPLVQVLRALNRMGLPPSSVSSALSAVFDDFLSHNRAVSPSPSQLSELVNIASKNDLIHPALFEYVIADLSVDTNAYSEDLIGDMARSFTNLRFSSPSFNSVLSAHLPTTVHELSWWNLVDIAEYYNKSVPTPRTDVDDEIIARFGNECWKWIPEMRCGYAAKALRVLSELGTGDKRTLRSLVRAIPKSLGKLHPQHVAESIVSAARIGYDPRARYGKKYGSLLYRRLASRLAVGPPNCKGSPLKTVKADLVVDVLAALAKVKRPENELFDFVILDIADHPGKYSLNQLVEIRQILSENFRFSRGRALVDGMIRARGGEAIGVSNLAHLATTCGDSMDSLMGMDPMILVGLSVDDIVSLIRTRDERVQTFALSEWLEYNLSSIGPRSILSFMRVLAETKAVVAEPTLLLLESFVDSAVTLSDSNDVAALIASVMILSQFRHIPSSRWFNQVTAKSDTNTDTIRLCQLICGHLRLVPGIKVDDSLFKFVSWIESHLLSKHAQPAHVTDFREWYVPSGAVTDLSVFPVTIALALPDPRIDLTKLHHSRTFASVHRALSSLGSDAGIALLTRAPEPSLASIMQEAYLTKLGWTVRYIHSHDDVADPGIVSVALLTDEPIHIVSS